MFHAAQKAYTESVRTKVSVGCTLHELCAEDKSKVAKLLRQVVELEKELTLTKAVGKKEKHDFQEKIQHIRQRNADVLRESNTLKAKLTHAFALLRAYQHKVKHMGTAAPVGPDLHSSNAVCFQRPQQLYCQRCGHTALLRSSDTAGMLDVTDGVTPSHRAPRVVLSADAGLQHPASTSTQDQLQSGHSQCADGGHHQLASAQAGAMPGRQEPFAELASEVLAWQLDSTASEGSAHQAADHEAWKVLRFDPSLGDDGAFYFISSQSVEMQPPAAQHEHGQMAPASSSRHQPAHAMVQQEEQQQASGSTLSQHMQPPGPATVQVAAQSGRQEKRAHPDAASAENGWPSSSDQAAASRTKDGIEMVAEAGTAQVQSVQENNAAAVSEQQRGVQAQPQFPVQGGGEAGVLLRAAAAAAAGCSHELVVAAAGRACKEEDSDSRPISHVAASVQPAPATATGRFPTYATSSGQDLLHKQGSASMPTLGQAERQPGDEQNTIGAPQEVHDDPSTGRVDDDLQSLGFDSSLMDLVTEVEQMVACKQASTALSDRQPAHDWRLPARGPGEEEDYEENDVISLISDQEYSMH
ncbi:hypothetical protein ABBQ38_002837 [Trebouxia sp. C0009 RCD-2024]